MDDIRRRCPEKQIDFGGINEAHSVASGHKWLAMEYIPRRV